MSKKRDDFRLSRRGLIRGLGAVAAAGLPGIGIADDKGRWFIPPANISDGYTDKQSYRPGDTVTVFLSGETPQPIANVRVYDYTGQRRVYEIRSQSNDSNPGWINTLGIRFWL